MLLLQRMQVLRQLTSPCNYSLREPHVFFWPLLTLADIDMHACVHMFTHTHAHTHTRKIIIFKIFKFKKCRRRKKKWHQG